MKYLNVLRNTAPHDLDLVYTRTCGRHEANVVFCLFCHKNFYKPLNFKIPRYSTVPIQYKSPITPITHDTPRSMCDWAITVVLFALGLCGRAAEAVLPAAHASGPHADVHAPAHRRRGRDRLPGLVPAGSREGPSAHPLQASSLAPTVSPLVRTRPRLLWCRFRTTAAIFSAIARGCSMARSRQTWGLSVREEGSLHSLPVLLGF